jgi:hypothetical protein
MYGAVPYLMGSFALDRESAFKIVCDWIDQQVETTLLKPLETKPRRRLARRRAA